MSPVVRVFLLVFCGLLGCAALSEPARIDPNAGPVMSTPVPCTAETDGVVVGDVDYTQYMCAGVATYYNPLLGKYALVRFYTRTAEKKNETIATPPEEIEIPIGTWTFVHKGPPSTAEKPQWPNPINILRPDRDS